MRLVTKKRSPKILILKMENSDLEVEGDKEVKKSYSETIMRYIILDNKVPNFPVTTIAYVFFLGGLGTAIRRLSSRPLIAKRPSRGVLTNFLSFTCTFSLQNMACQNPH